MKEPLCAYHIFWNIWSLHGKNQEVEVHDQVPPPQKKGIKKNKQLNVHLHNKNDWKIIWEELFIFIWTESYLK